MWTIPTIFVVAVLTAFSTQPFRDNAQGIGFDDLTYAPTLRKVLVPGGRTGQLALIDPDTQRVEIIDGFSEKTDYSGGHGEGITSSDTGRGLIFVTDRTTKRLDVVDPQAEKIIAMADLASGPDYVRFVPATNEVWVTEPRAERIEIFVLPKNGAPTPTHSGFISIAGGPESLVIGQVRAFTHLWRGESLAIDLKDRKVIGRWPNGCKGSRGIALDEERGFLFAACDEGKASVLSLKTGGLLGEASTGAGIDIIAYNPKLAHLYLPGADSGTMGIVGVSSSGKLNMLKTVSIVESAHCATADDRDQVYVCDPVHGKLLVFKDSLLPSK
jgi:hypothetical protein